MDYSSTHCSKCFFQSTHPTHTHTHQKKKKKKEQGVINAKKWKINISLKYSEVLSLDMGGQQQKNKVNKQTC